MVAAGAVLKSLYPKLFRVTCVAHLFRNCATKVKSHFKDIDRLIAIVKSAIVKKKQTSRFTTLVFPPQPSSSLKLFVLSIMQEDVHTLGVRSGPVCESSVRLSHHDE